MIILLSPAKTLDFSTSVPALTTSKPAYAHKADMLANELRKLQPEQLAQLMDISPKLAQLNHERFQLWGSPTNVEAMRPAVLAYKGDVYEGLKADSMGPDDLHFAQQHLRILSGMYGILRPLDLIQPYRLEMGTSFGIGQYKDLYAFWNADITMSLAEDLRNEAQPFIVNLASQEYSKSVDFKALNCRVIAPEFKDGKDGTYRMISFFAKRARGLMASWLIRNRVSNADDLVSFAAEGYVFNPRLSTPTKPVFTRG
ncbi:MAG: peroxide stress protein YaaA [Bacteroidetes bacterium]|nr:peroxide stress protein YaaA [Bacteroidota bacterium]